MKRSFTILAINPGSTSTEFGVLRNENLLFRKKIPHSKESLSRFKQIIDQVEPRKSVIIGGLKEEGISLERFDCISARGGILRPMMGGVYTIDNNMANDIKEGRVDAQHAANLGVIIAFDLAREYKIPSFMVEPISTDELTDVARVSGLPEIPRSGRTHTLNVRAQARKRARELGKRLEETSFIVAHIGGGTTVNLVKNGRICDVSDARQDGPFSPEACGGLSTPDYTKLCLSGKYSLNELVSFSYGKGGIVAHLGTNSTREVEERIRRGDKKAELVYRAFAYGIAKSIGAMAVASSGWVDSIILTGGVAHSKMLTKWIKEMVSFIGPVVIYPGSRELQALAEEVLDVLRGERAPEAYLKSRKY